MKIEKVNDHQIRCTLTKEDLANRKLKISELAYGSNKAKDLFRDMMEKASDEYGFEADNIPLMIEAIPVNQECIVLIITKVEDPEELDTRFSKFAPSAALDDDEDETDDDTSSFTPISDLFKRFKDNVKGQDTASGSSASIAIEGKAFCFDSIITIAKVCKSVASVYTGSSTVYRNKETGLYMLVLQRDKMDVQDFIQACNLFGEYSEKAKNKFIANGYLSEHFELVVEGQAVEKLKDLG